MSGFVIKKTSWHYRLNSSMSRDFSWCRSGGVSLCHYFWVTCAHLFMLSLVILMVSMLIGGFLTALYYNPLGVIAAILFFVGVIAACIFGAVGLTELQNRSKEEPRTLLGARVRAWKQKVCPIVKVE